MSKNSNNTNSVATTVQHSYEGKVISEALSRAGKCPNIKGHIHEIMYRDLQNILPKNILKGNVAELVKSPTAKCVDLVVKSPAGKIIERVQLKDVPASINKTLKQITSGQYNSVKLVGSEETVKEFSKVASKSSKSMKSSGISSKTTNRLATKTGNVSLTSKAGINALKTSAKSGAALGGAISGGIAAIQGIIDISDGKDVGEVAIDVAAETGKGAVTGAISGVAATTTASVTASTLGAVGVTGVTASAATIAAPIVAAVGVGLLANEILFEDNEIVSDIFDGVGTVVSDTCEGIGNAVGDLFDLIFS